MKTIILKNGIIGGIIVSIFMGLSIYNHSQNLENETLSYILGFSGMFIAFIFTFIGMKQYRDKVNDGSISFGKAFTIGLSIAFIISTIYVLVWLFELHNFYPDFMEKYAASEITKLQSSGLSATEIATETAKMNEMKESYKNPFNVIGMTYFEILPIGIFFSLIFALLVKKKQQIN